jgi:hypothetical protein
MIFIVGYIAYVGSWTRASLHYLLPVFPMLSLVAAVMLNDILEGARSRRLGQAIGIVTIIIIAGSGLWRNFGAIIHGPQESTTIAAKKWMEKNITTGTFIAYDDYPNRLPFFSPDVYLKSGTKFGYDKFMPEQLKQRILAYSRTHTSYRSIRLRNYLDKPLFPANWSPEFRKEHEKDLYLIEFYRLHFFTPEELYNKNVEYIIVSESYYSQFYDVHYPPDNPIYEYNRWGLAFYEGLFGANKFYTPVAEFNASAELCGGKIKIFRKKRTFL